MFKYVINEQRQLDFAKLSNDFNPIHVDPLYAWRSMFGKQLVHGIHQVLICLEDLAKNINEKIFIFKISAKFESPAGVNETICIDNINFSETYSEYVIKNERGLTLTTLKVHYKKKSFTNFNFKLTNYTTSPLEPSNYAKENLAESLYYNKKFLKELFKELSSYVSPVNLAVLLASTRIVGMKYPGLNSIYSSFVFEFDEEANINNSVHYSVSDKHIVLNMLNIKLDDTFVRGQIKAFIRPVAPKYKTLKELKGLLPVDSFKNQRALIIGGTRGIGLQCLRLLANAGASTLFTYFKNSNEADKIVKEFASESINTNYVQVDVSSLSKESLEIIKAFNPTSIYYFATPKILSNNSNLDEKLLQEFIYYYVIGLDKILVSLKSELKPIIFVPSTVYLDEKPTNLSEYVIAKSASEMFLKLLEKKGYKIYNPRFPKVSTEQTMSLFKQKAVEPEEVLLEELKNMIK